VPEDVGPPIDEPSITVVDSRFEPGEIVVTVGTEVQWVWDARIVHDVAGEGFRTDPKNAGTFAHVFTAPGAYEFVCTLHAGMGGTVFVVDS
jgi:plastocyanin